MIDQADTSGDAVVGADDRRADIVSVSAQLFVEHGIAGTSIRQIGNAVGILGPSLYHHFRSKDELVHVILSGPTAALTEAYRSCLEGTADAGARFVGMVDASFASMARYPHATRIYMGNTAYFARRPLLRDLVDAAAIHRQMWVDVIAEGASTGVFRSDIDPELLGRIVQTAIWSTPHPWDVSAHSLDALRVETTNVLLHGMHAPLGRAAGAKRRR